MGNFSYLYSDYNEYPNSKGGIGENDDVVLLIPKEFGGGNIIGKYDGYGNIVTEKEKYFINNEIYIQFSDYYKRKNIVKKAEFFISEVEEVEFNGETQENEFALYARLEIDGKIVKLNEYLAKNRLNLLDILVKEKDVENEYY